MRQGSRNSRTEAPGLAVGDVFDSLKADYSAAKYSRFRRQRTGLLLQGSGADYHYRWILDYLRMIEYARAMDRDDAVIGQMIDRAVLETVGDGFQLDVQTGDEKLDADLAARWDDWCKDADACDVSGEMSFPEIERLVLRQQHVDGDIVCLFLLEGQLQLVEAHRIRTPTNTTKNVVHGILLDERRRRLEYWATKDDINPMQPLSRVADVDRYPVRDAAGRRVLTHVYHAKRCTQTRGVTALAPVFDVCGMFEDINFAKLVQAQVASCFAVIRQRSVDWQAPAGATPPHGETTHDQFTDGQAKLLQGFSPGMEIEGNPGEELTGFSPRVPNPEFFPHVRLMLTLMGINLGVPYVMLMMDASETNFSGYRGAVDQARKGFRSNQKHLIRRFHDPVYAWKLQQWIADDPALARQAIRSDIDITGHVWSVPGWPYIEPLKDATAQATRIRHLLTSPRRLHAEQGNDWQDIVVEVVADNSLMIRAAKKEADDINAKFPAADEDVPVTWRDLISLATADQVSLAVRTGPEQPTPPPSAPTTPKQTNRIGHLVNGNA